MTTDITAALREALTPDVERILRTRAGDPLVRFCYDNGLDPSKILDTHYGGIIDRVAQASGYKPARPTPAPGTPYIS